MRIHALRVQAFGPFADEVEIDLDSLSEAGLFLLTGATGAGKTSILDAVCFALYGAVPGDRQIAKRLRCDQAPAGVAPEVSLELTLAGRRFRIDRSPAWERPKKRGTGTTTQQASVLVRERVDGSWVPRATRLDEAGLLLGGLLGMNLTQFCQVQMLPQGRFQTFLRAGSEDRHRLLQQLFRTSRFEAVEAWLRDHRRELGRESARHHDRVGALVSRVSEAAGSVLPDHWDLSQLGAALVEVEPWADSLLEGAVEGHARAVDALGPAEQAAAASRQELDAARVLLERRHRHERAREELERLLASTEEQEEALVRLDRGRRAVAVLPLAEAAAEAQRLAVATAQRAADDLGALETDHPRAPGGTEDLAELVRSTTEAASEARALLPRVAELDALRVGVADDGRRLALLDDQLAELAAEAAELPGTLAVRTEAEQEAQRAADGLDAADAEVASARARLECRLGVDELLSARAEAAELLRDAVDRSQTARETWLDLQERRLSGMAAEIAGGLAVGADCPVCGSPDHPQPARPAPGAPDAETVRAARSASDDAEVERHARELALAELDARIAAAREAAGSDDEESLRAAVARCEERAAHHRTLAAGLASARRDRARVDRRLEEVRGRHHTLHGQRSALAASLAEREERSASLRGEVDAVLSRSGYESVTALLAALQGRAAAAGRALDSHREAARCRAEADRAEARAQRVARDQGFDAPADAATAADEAGDLGSLQEQVDGHRQRLAAAEAALADPDLTAAAAVDPPDLDALGRQHRQATSRLVEARDAASAAGRRLDRLDSLVGDLASALAAWRPVRERHCLVDRLAGLADGSSTDNRLRMRLSGYVLAARLTQVVAAANERLATMLDGRYRLEHSDDRGAGESRGGLSLRVRDEWSGESRDPVTLSGGETFVVALALALGLSDVISHEAGGAELDTLFVDEGFGTLDADSLDHVMDMLDTLRDGGRVVGVVSHVAELRDRIPAQLHVEKRRTGSRVHQSVARSAIG